LPDSSDIGGNKGRRGDDIDSSMNNYDDFSRSTILTARFGHESVKVIHLVKRNLYIVIGLIVSIAVLSVMNIFGIFEYFSTENVDRLVDIILLVILIVVLVPLVLLLLKSKNVLDRWADMFERNTIATSMKIAMNKRSREEAVLAVAQSVKQIGEPLQDYITSKKTDLKEFLNISIDKDIIFDILIDSSHVLFSSSNDKDNNNLKDLLKEYGAIVIKIVDDSIKQNIVKSFVDSLTRYVSLTNNQVGLGIIIGEDVASEAERYASKFSKRREAGINHLLLIAKPTYPPTEPPPGQTFTAG
jgi:hypothetical protein